MTVRILTGDCREVLKTLPDASVDSIVTDPPYGLAFMGKRWDYDVPSADVWREALRVLKPGGHLLAFSGTRTYHRMACAIEDAGFEIRDQIGWVYSSGFPKSLNLDRERGNAICGCEPVEGVAEASECDVRPVLDAHVPAPFALGGERGEVLQPCVSQQGVSVGVLQRPAATEGRGKSRVEGRRDPVQDEGQLRERAVCASAGMGSTDGAEGRLHHGAPTGDGRMVRFSSDADGGGAPRRPQAAEQRAQQPRTVAGQPEPQTRGAWPVCGGCGLPVVPRGLGTALKPAWEPICMARKPLVGTVAANVLAHGTGALNIDGCRIATSDKLGGGAEKATTPDQKGNDGWVRPWMESEAARDAHAARVRANVERAEAIGRWPANLIHDGSEEVLQAFPDAPGQQADESRTAPSSKTSNTYGRMNRAGEPSADSDNEGAVGFKMKPGARRLDTGSAARFFKECSWQDHDPQRSLVPTVEPSSCLQSVLGASVQSGAAIWASLAGIVSSDSKEPSTNVTPSESRTIAELVITAMAPIGSESSRASRHEKHSPCGSRVSVAVERKQTGTTTITANLYRFDGSVARATFNITPTSLDRGVVASRLKYVAKADKADRGEGNTHPTVKPGDLMRYLCRLVTPPGGTVLDPFAGSGSTLLAADREGFNAIGIEMNQEYAEMARRRIHGDAPLFAEVDGG